MDNCAPIAFDVGQPHPNASVQKSPFYQSSFARSLSINIDQSQQSTMPQDDGDDDGDSSGAEELLRLSPFTQSAEAHSTHTLATTPPSPAGSPTDTPPLPASSPPSLLHPLANGRPSADVMYGSDVATPQSDHSMECDRGGHSAGQAKPTSDAHASKPRHGRMYVPSMTPKRRYSTLNNHVRTQQDVMLAQRANGVCTEFEVLRLRKECQSLIEDNRRLISAADRQPRTRSTGAEDENDDDPVRTSSAVLDHHRYLPSYKQKQHLKQPNFYYQQQRQTSSASPFISSSSNGVSGGGCNTSKNHVETVVLQTKIDTLQWQLKQVESNREMYHAVMEEVVRFLERCHQTLNTVGLVKQLPMSRSKSVNQVFVPSDTSSLLNEPIRDRARIDSRPDQQHKQNMSSSNSSGHNGKHQNPAKMLMMCSLDENLDISVTGRMSEPFGNSKDLTWRRTPKQQTLQQQTRQQQTDQEKLSQEAFRLLRTAQNLLNLKGPKLAQTENPPATIPAANDDANDSNRTVVVHASNANTTIDCRSRVGSTTSNPTATKMLQRKSTCRQSRSSLQSSTDDSIRSTSSSLSSRQEIDDELLDLVAPYRNANGRPNAPFCLQSSSSSESSSSSSFLSSADSSSAATNHHNHNQLHQPHSHHHHHHYRHQQQLNAANAGQIQQQRFKSIAASSADDESGFSSMSSFHDIGLPLTPTSPPSTPSAAATNITTPPELPPRSRLSSTSATLSATDNRSEIDSGSSSSNGSCIRRRDPSARPLSICHRRWSSAPAPPVPPKRNLSAFVGDGVEPLKLLWV